MNIWSLFKRKVDRLRKFSWFSENPELLPEITSFSVDAMQAAKSKYLEALKPSEDDDDEAAISMYSDAIAIVPIFWEALDNRGLCYMRKQQFERAIADFETSVRIFETSSLAFVALTECYKRTHQFRKAYLNMRETRRRWPDKAPFAKWDHFDRASG